MARARSTDSFLLRASQAAGATGSDQRKRPRRSTSPLSSRVSHTPATCWGLKFKMGSWNIEAAPAAAGPLSWERDTQQMPAVPFGAAGTHLWGGGGGSATAGSEIAGGIGGGAGPAARVRLGSVRARRQATRASTGVGGLAARAPWRPPVSHWPALPIKTATRASEPFQHLPALDSARRSPEHFSSLFCRT